MIKLENFPEKIYLISCNNELIFKKEVNLLKNKEKFAIYIYKNGREITFSLKEINRLCSFSLLKIN